MARVTLAFDSATPDEVYSLTLAFQRTSGPAREGGLGGHEVPAQTPDRPVVSVVGAGMSWRSPALTPAHAAALLAEHASARPEI